MTSAQAWTVIVELAVIAGLLIGYVFGPRP